MIAIVDADLLIYRIGHASNGVGGKFAIRMMADFVEDMCYNFVKADYVEGYLTGSDNYMLSPRLPPTKGTGRAISLSITIYCVSISGTPGTSPSLRARKLTML